MRGLLLFGSVSIVLICSFALAQAPAVKPPQRSPASNAAPPPRPPEGDLQGRAKLLFDAIVRDDPTLAKDVFFPRDAFLKVKAMRDPGQYYDRLAKRFEQDIHALHKSLGSLENATFERLELAKRGGFVKPGDEGNHLPYWASRHSWLHYRVGNKTKRFEVRVLITWEDRWYVIHLNEFH